MHSGHCLCKFIFVSFALSNFTKVPIITSVKNLTCTPLHFKSLKEKGLRYTKQRQSSNSVFLQYFSNFSASMFWTCPEVYTLCLSFCLENFFNSSLHGQWVLIGSFWSERPFQNILCWKGEDSPFPSTTTHTILFPIRGSSLHY